MSNQQIKILYLDELEISSTASIGLEIISLIVGTNQEAISKAQKAVNHTWKSIEDRAEQRKIVELIETVLVYKLKNLTREEIEAMFTMDDLKETRYFQDVRAEAKQEGIQEGLQEGLEKEKSLVIRQLECKISNLAPELELQVRNLPLEVLEDLGEALLDFSSQEDLISWLNSLWLESRFENWALLQNHQSNLFQVPNQRYLMSTPTRKLRDSDGNSLLLSKRVIIYGQKSRYW